MKKIALLSFSLCMLVGCASNSFESKLTKLSTFTNAMSNYTESITFKKGQKYDYSSDKAVINDATYEEVLDYKYDYYVYGQVLTHESHKKTSHIKIYRLNDFTYDGKSVYFGYDDEHHKYSSYSYDVIGLFSTDKEVNEEYLNTFREELDGQIISGRYGKINIGWKLYHYQKGKDYQPVTSVTANYTSREVLLNDDFKLEITIEPRRPTDNHYIYKIDDEEIIKVDKIYTDSENNRLIVTIKGLKVGTTNITFKFADDHNLVISVTVKGA